jgi:hypothetical protein
MESCVQSLRVRSACDARAVEWKLEFRSRSLRAAFRFACQCKSGFLGIDLHLDGELVTWNFSEGEVNLRNMIDVWWSHMQRKQDGALSDLYPGVFGAGLWRKAEITKGFKSR